MSESDSSKSEESVDIIPLSSIPLIWNKPTKINNFVGTVKCEWEPKFKEFSDYKKRYQSFHDSPNHLRNKVKDFSQSGFFYAGRLDSVYCFFCGIALNRWEFSDNAFSEHIKYSPHCKYMKMICCL